MTIGEFSVKQPVLVNLFFLAIIIVGVSTFFSMPAEMLPNVSMDEAVVYVFYPGVSPEEMETLVTKPLEEEIESVEDVENISSVSGESRTIIDVRFKAGLSDDEFDQRILDLRSAVDNARSEMPDDAEVPEVLAIKLGEVIPIVSISLGGPVSETVLREVAEDLRDDVLDVPYVKAVDVVGTREREIQIAVDADRLEAFGLPIGTIVGALASRNLNVPAGTIELGNSEYIVRTLGEFESIQDIENHVIMSDEFGRQVRIGDVAAVRDTLEERMTLSRLDGERSVTLWATKERQGSVVNIVSDIRDVVESFDERLSEPIAFEVRNDTSIEVRDTLAILERNAVFGVILVSLILFVFIGLRNSILAVIGIPFSFFAAFILMDASGITVNTISLFSLVLVLGMLVDDAIIVIENIYRHIEEGMSPKEAAILGTKEVQAPVTAAVLTTIAAFLPLLLMTGTWGKFMSVIPKTVTFALLASLVEALFILPSHMADFARVANRQNKCHPTFLGLTKRYERLLRRALRRRYATLGLVFLMAFAAIALFFTLDISIFEEEDVDAIEIRAQLPIGTKIEITDRAARQMEEILFSLPEGEVEAVVTRVGFMIANYRGQLATHNMQFDVDLTDREMRERSDVEIMDDLRKRMSQVAGLTSLSLTRPQQGPPSGEPVEVRVKGEDPLVLERIARQMQEALAGFPGVVEIDDDLTPGKSELRVGVIPDQAALYGLSASDIASAVRTGFEGAEATKYRGSGDDEIDVIVRFEEEDRLDLDDLRHMMIPTPTGANIPLDNVATLEVAEAPAELNRRDGDRIVTVTADIEEGTTSTEVNRFLMKEFEDVPERFPGYRLDFGGEFQETQESFMSLLMAFGVAILLIYLILGTEFQSFIQPLIIMFTVPFAFIGVIVGLVVMRYPFTLNAGVAIVALAGVVVNDSIVLIDFIKKAREQGVDRWESVVQGGCMRLRPILLTSITTILGVLPLALGWGGVSVTWGPMAASLAWGLGFATVLTLFVIPAIFSIVDDIRIRVGRMEPEEKHPALETHYAEQMCRLKEAGPESRVLGNAPETRA